MPSMGAATMRTTSIITSKGCIVCKGNPHNCKATRSSQHQRNKGAAHNLCVAASSSSTTRVVDRVHHGRGRARGIYDERTPFHSDIIARCSQRKYVTKAGP
eukprot:6301771-Pyramimonas_sp.AAC.1